MAKKPRRGLTFRATLLMIAVIAILFLTIAPAREILRQRAEIDDLATELNNLKKQNRDLRVETQRLNTDAYIEQQARERLGLIKPGEEPFLLVPPKQEPPKPAQPAKPDAKPKPAAKSWWQQILEYFGYLFN